MKQNNYQDKLIDLAVKETWECPIEKKCYINDILFLVDETIKEKLAEQKKEIVKELKKKYPHSKLLTLDEIIKIINIK